MNETALLDTFRALRNINSVFVAFNGNIDNIKHVDSTLEKFANSSSSPRLGELKSPQDLFSGIMYSMKYGESIELVMHKNLEDWISKNIRPEKQRMGGQAGIMANLLSSFGVQPIVYVPLLSKEQCRLFSRRVLLIDSGLKHPHQVKRNDRTKINWIFEFNKGQKFLGVEAKDATRFIAASRPENFRLRKINLDFDFSCAVLSGFQCVLEKYSDGRTYRDQFKLAENLVKKIKKMGKPVHIEIAFSKSRPLVFEILKLASMADSIGLDESELIRILDILGDYKLAKRIHLNHDIVDVFLGAEKLSKKISTKKIHIHGHGYFMAICREYHIHPQDIRKSMEFASVVAAAKAHTGSATRSTVKTGLNFPVSKIGKDKEIDLGKFLKKKGIILKGGIGNDMLNKREIIFVPTRMVHSVRDVVGLGDIISASIFAAETAYSLEKKK